MALCNLTNKTNLDVSVGIKRFNFYFPEKILEKKSLTIDIKLTIATIYIYKIIYLILFQYDL